MTRLSIMAAAAVLALLPQSAAAERVDAAGVLQQGKGGGKQENAGPRGQGGGAREPRAGGQGKAAGRDDARPSAERRQGGAQPTRPSAPTPRADRPEAASGRSPAQSGRGGGASAEARSERGTGPGASSASPAARAGGVDARGSGPRRDRLTGPRLRASIDELSPGLRRMAASTRPGERMAAGAVARGRARGADADAFDVRGDGGRLRIMNRGGVLLLDLDDTRARDLGAWRLRRMGDRRPAANAPAFCRSGAGHPVFGREWCLDKGFGLGSRAGTIWSRGGIDDVIWRRRGDDRLDRGGLASVLGDVVLGRLALQAITLGYDQPLVGFWVAQPEGPRILRVHSGEYEVAELVDTDRDDRVDVLYVVQPVW